MEIDPFARNSDGIRHQPLPEALVQDSINMGRAIGQLRYCSNTADSKLPNCTIFDSSRDNMLQPDTPETIEQDDIRDLFRDELGRGPNPVIRDEDWKPHQ